MIQKSKKEGLNFFLRGILTISFRFRIQKVWEILDPDPNTRSTVYNEYGKP